VAAPAALLGAVDQAAARDVEIVVLSGVSRGLLIVAPAESSDRCCPRPSNRAGRHGSDQSTSREHGNVSEV